MPNDQQTKAEAVMRLMNSSDSATAAAAWMCFQVFLAGLVSVAIYKLIRTERSEISYARKYCANATAWAWLIEASLFAAHKDAFHFISGILVTLAVSFMALLLGAGRDIGWKVLLLKPLQFAKAGGSGAREQLRSTQPGAKGLSAWASGSPPQPRRLPRLQLGWAWFALALVGLAIGALETRFEHFGPGNIYMLDRWRGQTCFRSGGEWQCSSIQGSNPWTVVSTEPMAKDKDWTLVSVEPMPKAEGEAQASAPFDWSTARNVAPPGSSWQGDADHPAYTTATNQLTGERAILVSGQWRTCSAFDSISAKLWEKDTNWAEVANSEAFEAASAAQQIETKNRYFAEVLVPRMLAAGKDQGFITSLYHGFMTTSAPGEHGPWDQYKAGGAQ